MSGPRWRFRHWLPVLLIAAGLAILPLYLVLDRGPASDMERIKRLGKIRVLTFEGPTTYYHTPDGPSGLEYDLLSAFADDLGVHLEIEIADSVVSIFPRLLRGDADFAAASLSVTEARQRILSFTDPYQTIRTEVVYKRGNPQPKGFKDLVGRKVAVPAGSAYAQLLRARKNDYPELQWSEHVSETPEDLLNDVWEQNIDATFCSSNLFAIVRQHYPDLRVGFSLPSKYQLAWAFRPDTDRTLVQAANAFLARIRKSGELARLLDRYYGPASKFDYVNVRTFRRQIRTTLPHYEQLFKEAAARFGLDWRLLAAQSYQESYWKPGAVSPTGVQGLMQLTQATADYIDVQDRTDPRQSVLGGAKYLRSIHERINESVPEPDRTWFALAAYNVGLGHLLDAREIARRRNEDPNRWTNVKSALELLTRPEWYRKTKHGFARGNEAVAYVTRIRSFFDILSQLEADPLKSQDMNIDVPAL